MEKWLGVRVTDIIKALEREAANTDTDPRWRAASALREWTDGDRRTLMCMIEIDPQVITADTL
jgi:hypothetical protein